MMDKANSLKGHKHAKKAGFCSFFCSGLFGLIFCVFFYIMAFANPDVKNVLGYQNPKGRTEGF